MERIEKIKLAIKKGYTCDVETGKVYSRFGREILIKGTSDYLLISLRSDKKNYQLKQHQFIYYKATGKIV